MTAVRQDAWSKDDDLLLAETVLRHIREGSTQLSAFEEVGKSLSRTSAACGFRWNSLVRKKYESAILLAKKQRKELSKGKKKRLKAKNEQNPSEMKPPKTEPQSSPNHSLDMASVIDYLTQLKDGLQEQKELQKDNDRLAQDVSTLKQENEELAIELKNLKEKYKMIKDDYRSLLTIMERARKLAGDSEEEKNAVTVPADYEKEAIKVEK